MVEIAARAGARIARVQQIIKDQYYKPSEADILIAEMQAEIKNTGHAYDPYCLRPFCMKYREMFTDAREQAIQGGA